MGGERRWAEASTRANVAPHCFSRRLAWRTASVLCAPPAGSVLSNPAAALFSGNCQANKRRRSRREPLLFALQALLACAAAPRKRKDVDLMTCDQRLDQNATANRKLGSSRLVEVPMAFLLAPLTATCVVEKTFRSSSSSTANQRGPRPPTLRPRPQALIGPCEFMFALPLCHICQGEHSSRANELLIDWLGGREIKGQRGGLRLGGGRRSSCGPSKVRRDARCH